MAEYVEQGIYRPAGQTAPYRPVATWQAGIKPAPGPGYLAGTFPEGVTSLDGAPLSATVRVLYRPGSGALGDGALMASVKSAHDGTWRVDGLDPALRFDVVCRLEGFNDLILSNVSPVPY